MSEDDVERELRRLRGLGAWMREVGATELSLGEVHIKLGAAPRVARPSGPADADERAELSDEERKLAAQSAAEREHNKFWRRVTRSSGTPIPPFRAPKGTAQ